MMGVKRIQHHGKISCDDSWHGSHGFGVVCAFDENRMGGTVRVENPLVIRSAARARFERPAAASEHQASQLSRPLPIKLVPT
ncbi:MAG: hypothetical protein HOV81_37700 [Kofleriaceae bacterium]|nr:hypothetical protein [Kofleriaceae bacterium]